MEFMTLRAVQNEELKQALNFVSMQLNINIEAAEIRLSFKTSNT